MTSKRQHDYHREWTYPRTPKMVDFLQQIGRGDVERDWAAGREPYIRKYVHDNHPDLWFRFLAWRTMQPEWRDYTNDDK